jgi:hypothetical protein
LNTRFTRKPTCKIPNPLYPDLDHSVHLILWDWHRYSDFKTEISNEKRKLFKIMPEYIYQGENTSLQQGVGSTKYRE